MRARRDHTALGRFWEQREQDFPHSKPRRAALSSVVETPSNRTIVGPQFEGHLLNHNVRREPQMKRLVLASAVFLTFAPAVALAQGRGGDAALGALSGAVVFGPVGAVAGAVVGYTAGPSIAHSWGFRRSGSKKPLREKSQAGMPTSRVSQNTPATAASPELARATTTLAPAKPASSTAQRWVTPPVQGLE
jgi:hypothetical protein